MMPKLRSLEKSPRTVYSLGAFLAFGLSCITRGVDRIFLILAELECCFAVQLVYHQELQTNWG